MRIAGREPFTRTEPSYLSLINIPYKAGVRLGLFPNLAEFEFRSESAPLPFFAADTELGYKCLPNKYVQTYFRRWRGDTEWEQFKINVSVNPDGTRWTGNCDRDATRNVHILGDSLSAGSGVNDEQTFAFLLQVARRDVCVKLHAVGGYGTPQSFIQFNDLRSSIRRDDIVVLGYADFLDVRNVVAPSRLRETDTFYTRRVGHPPYPWKLPKASLNERGEIQITYVQQRCNENHGYCDQSDPPRMEMTRTTAALINTIAQASPAPVYLLHYDGSADNPLLGYLSSSVRRISALGNDFDYSMRDDVEGFDPHPGPYWHYAISRKLIEQLERNGRVSADAPF